MSVSPFHTRPWRTARTIALLLPAAGLLAAALLMLRRPPAPPELEEIRYAADLVARAAEAGPREGALERMELLLRAPPPAVHGRIEDAVSDELLATFGQPLERAENVRAERILFADDRPLRLALQRTLPPAAGNGRVVAAALGAALLGAAAALVVGWRGALRSAAEATAAAAEVSALAAAAPRSAATHAASTAEIDEVARISEDALLEARRRLEALERQAREQQAILQSMRNGLLAIDPDQRLLRVNRAAVDMLGIELPDVRGRLVQAVTRQPGLNRFLSEAIAADEPTQGEFAIDREGRPRIVVQALSEPLHDAEGGSTGLLVSLSDVTTLRRLESLRADFAANVSHELRTPITNIKGYAETLLQVGVEDPEQANKFLHIISRNAQRLGSIIEDLLALARLEQPGARESLEQSDVPVRQLVDAVRENLGSAAQAKQITIVDQTGPGLCVHVMASLAEQALANLVSNAITYSPPGAEVRIGAAQTAEGLVEIRVADTGPGIAPHQLARIFERFYRVDRARSRDHGGTGLGLAIVKHIALVHGGRVEVESRLGAGSTFRLLLPEARGPEATSPPMAGARARRGLD